MNPKTVTVVRRVGFGLIVIVGCVILYRPAMKSKIGRWMMGVCVVRLVNNADAIVKDVRLSYRRSSSRSRTLQYEEIGDIRPGETRDIVIAEKEVTGDEVTYGFAGEVRHRSIPEYIFAGSIIEVTFAPGGWVQSRATH